MGALSSVALACGYLDTLVPIPIPGVRLGLANVAVLMALAAGDARQACAVGAVKVLASGLLFGSPLALAYGAPATALALALMVPLSRLPTMRLEMVSVVGALAHEAGQLLVAQALLGTPLVWYAAAPLLGAGCLCGWLCGAVAARSLALLGETGPCPAADGTPAAGRTREAGAGGGPGVAARRPGGDARAAGGRARAAAAAYLALVVVILRGDDLRVLGAGLLAALASCLRARAGAAALARGLRAVAPVAALTLVAQLACTRAGMPLAQVAGVTVTDEGLRLAAASLLRLGALCALGTAALAALGGRGPDGGVARLLAPLGRLGLRTEGLAYALGIVARLAPSLVEGLAGQGGRRRLGSPRAWADALPALVARIYRQALADAPPEAADG